jgi:aryl-alcohol dehydrogenase-like predicted oxidoreductase
VIGLGPSVAGIEKALSSIALGTAWFSHGEDELCRTILDDFIADGGTAIDTARNYGDSEEVIGAWLSESGTRDDLAIITKGGLSQTDTTKLAEEGLDEKVEYDISASLDKLRTDYIDLFFLHRDTVSIPVEGIIDCLNEQLDSGNIGAFGGSNWEPRRIDEANEYARENGLTGFSAVSNNVSLAIPTGPFYPGLVSMDEDGEDWLERTGITLFSWSSQARGFFTGRYLSESDEDPFAKNMFRVYGTEENRARLDRARELGKDKGDFSAVQIALAWVLHRPYAIVPIVGPRSREELDSCVQALDIVLNESESRWLALGPRPGRLHF